MQHILKLLPCACVDMCPLFCCRADAAERNLAAAQESLADTHQSLKSLQTHHSALKQHLERAELHSQDSATQAREFAARLKELSTDKEALVSELVIVNKSAAQMKQDFKSMVKCLKGSEPLKAITEFLEEPEADSGHKAHSSELTWVMKRLSDHFRQSSGVTSCNSYLLRDIYTQDQVLEPRVNGQSLILMEFTITNPSTNFSSVFPQTVSTPQEVSS